MAARQMSHRLASRFCVLQCTLDFFVGVLSHLAILLIDAIGALPDSFHREATVRELPPTFQIHL